MSGTDILAQARAHAWWHSDQSLAFNLIHEIERLRRENEALSSAMSSDGAAACGQLAVAEAEIERLRSELNMAVVAKHEAEDKADEMFEGCMERTAKINRLRAEIARLREHFAIQAEGEADDARLI